MRYSNYIIEENKDGTWSALVDEGGELLATASSEDELDNLMELLEDAYLAGVVAGNEEQKYKIRRKLGL